MAHDLMRALAVLASLAGVPCPAGTPPQHPADASLADIVVTAERAAAADESLRRRIESALAADPYVFSDHVTITVANGVATVHGIVFDDWDLRNALRVARHIHGVKRVVDELEIQESGD